ncbi:SURF1 family protein [Vibrio bivalvicida]|uniref:SURF1-like protein n=2 Tax=Vibrio bivalvicida TaxID=1276888 RepID=A0ABV4MDU3_9VIBR
MSGSFFAPLKTTRFVVVCLITVVAFSILINLGLWQLSRADEKSQIEQKVIQRAQMSPIGLPDLTQEQISNPSGVKVVLSAIPVMDKYLLLDNQSVDGKVGYLALQLVKTQSGKYLLLERGYVEAPDLRSQLPQVDWLNGEHALEGRLYRKSRNPLSKDLHLEQGTMSRIQNLNFAQLEQHWQIELEPFVVQPLVESWPYIQPWQPVSMNPDKHLGYAVQWFSMAAVLALLSVGLLVRALKQGVRDE